MEIALLYPSLVSGSLFYALIFYIRFQMSNKEATEPILVVIHWRAVLASTNLQKKVYIASVSYVNNLGFVWEIHCFNSCQLQDCINGNMIQPVFIKVQKMNFVAWNENNI